MNDAEKGIREMYGDELGEAFERGLETRRKVLGDKHVDQSLASATDFNLPIQRYTTEVCWDRTWNRPGLSHRDRSLLNLGMLCALNRPRELGTHVRGALNNGVKPEEMTEIFLQVAVYCGLPAAMDAFKIAKSVIEEESANS